MTQLSSLLALVRRGSAASTETNAPFAGLWVLLRQILGLLFTRRDPARINALFAETEEKLARTLFERALLVAGRTDVDPAAYHCRLVWRGDYPSLQVTPRVPGAAKLAFDAPLNPAAAVRRALPPGALSKIRNWRRRLRLPSRYTRREQVWRRFEQLSRRRPAHRKTVRRLPPRLACVVAAPP